MDEYVTENEIEKENETETEDEAENETDTENETEKITLINILIILKPIFSMT